ncbi:DUF1445 domain-containing protein [Gordonia rubripertincta]|uniref:DUF1445 domain-containing protein n=1 Tax=Gordonia rubripertincta TaxID=36822 RepID=A0ABT4MZF1_GORRU|nr:DUF1445 domain-containing protein [Gordonia rubripertincta]MCZ4552372.1 DUF1445 domain-containing protein [Gordonia rubripertincta]
MSPLEILATGPMTTVQDGGRAGLAALGVGRSGAADRRSYGLANRLLANPEGAAALEVTLGGLSLRAGDETFLIGCSFTFEAALLDAGVPVRHIEQGRNVPMYRTSKRCRPAGSLHGPEVVSMRPVPADLVATAVRVTSRYPAVHGAPVHIGDPGAIGIDDLGVPDFGDAVEIRPGEIPVFWACGVTPQAAVMESRPALAIGHAPGHMVITDARDSDYLVP